MSSRLKLRLQRCLFGFCVACHGGFVVATPPPESLMRAAVVGGIVQYTIWSAEQAPTTLCTVGQPMSEQPLREAGRRHALGDAPLRIRAVSSHDRAGLRQCPVLVVGKLSAPEQSRLAEQLRQQDSLLICDGCDAGILPAHIVLFTRDERIGFVVRLPDPGKTRIRFRSDLLELAAEVRRLDGEVRP